MVILLSETCLLVKHNDSLTGIDLGLTKHQVGTYTTGLCLYLACVLHASVYISLGMGSITGMHICYYKHFLIKFNKFKIKK